MEEIKNENIEAIKEVETEVVEEKTEKKSPMAWLKKNGKKVAKGAAIGAGILAAYAIGKGSGSRHTASVDGLDDGVVEFDDSDLSNEN